MARFNCIQRAKQIAEQAQQNVWPDLDPNCLPDQARQFLKGDQQAKKVAASWKRVKSIE